jgi:hypothetical protein
MEFAEVVMDDGTLKFAQQMAHDVLAWVGFGTLVGLLAKAIMPGKDPGGAVATLAMGIGGTVMGLGTLGLLLRRWPPDHTDQPDRIRRSDSWGVPHFVLLQTAGRLLVCRRGRPRETAANSCRAAAACGGGLRRRLTDFGWLRLRDRWLWSENRELGAGCHDEFVTGHEQIAAGQSPRHELNLFKQWRRPLIATACRLRAEDQNVLARRPPNLLADDYTLPQTTRRSRSRCGIGPAGWILSLLLSLCWHRTSRCDRRSQ